MVRTLGGCIGLAICSAVSRSTVNPELRSFLSASQISAISRSTAFLSSLPATEQMKVRSVYGNGFNEQFRTLIAFAGANVLASVGLIFGRRHHEIQKARRSYSDLPIPTNGRDQQEMSTSN